MTYICHILIKYIVKVNQMTTINKNLADKIFKGSIEELVNKGIITLDGEYFTINQLFKDAFKKAVEKEVNDISINKDPEDSGREQEFEIGCFKCFFVLNFDTETTYFPDVNGVGYDYSNFESTEINVVLEDEDNTCYDFNPKQEDFLIKAFNQ